MVAGTVGWSTNTCERRGEGRGAGGIIEGVVLPFLAPSCRREGGVIEKGGVH